MRIPIPNKPDTVQWTDDQWKAIMAKGQDILVAAAAGSGKTAVLVERMIQKMIDEEDPIDVDQLLVVTFTNAAAAEMRHRIGEALEKAISADPASSHLRKQLSLLNSAHISTLHSFCLEVIRKFYYVIDMDPGFRIADDTEADLMRDEVLDELFELEYSKPENTDFYRLVDSFTTDRNDIDLQELILKLYDFSRSHPHPDQWLDQIVDMFTLPEEATVDDLPFIDVLKADMRLQIAGAKELLMQALEIAYEPGGPAPRIENYQDDIAVIERIEVALEQNWDEMYAVMNQWKFTRAKSCRGDEYDENLVKSADERRKRAKSILEKITKELFSRAPHYYLNDMREMRAVYVVLIQVVKKFSTLYTQKKSEKGLVDFPDLEHSCLQILMEEDQLPAIKPSEIAFLYRNQFREVLVDEYQDSATRC